MADEQVRFDIKIDVQAAIKQLKNIGETSENSAEAVKRLSLFLAKMSRETRVPLEQLRKTMADLNREFAKQTGAGAFSAFKGGDKGIFNAVKGYNDAAIASGRFAATQNGVVTSVNKSSKAMEDADKKARGFGHGIDIIRTALGTLAAVGIFQFLSALQAVFTQLIHNIRETELALNNLINAEKRLSEEGIDISPKQLEEMIARVRELVPILSQVDAEELVSRIANNLAPALKLTREEIEKMAVITGSLYVKNKALGYSYDEVEKAVNDAFLTGKVSQGLNKFGVKINDQIVKEEALRLGLVKTAEEFDNLTGEMEAQVKTQAMLNILWGDAQNNLQAMPEYMKTFDSQVERTKTAWSDLLTTLGNAGLAESLAKVFSFIAGILEAWVEIIEVLQPLMVGFLATAIAGWTALGYKITHPLASIQEFMKVFNETQTQTIREMMESLGDAMDTPTGDPQINTDESIQNLEELEQAIGDVKDKYEQDLADLDKELERKLADLDEEYNRKALDAEVDLRRKIEDINRDAERDIAKIKDKHREQDQRDEEKYQLALWELRQRFLMDLEDALHARDARQVIRLQKQYNLDKEALRRKHELDSSAREDDQKDELEDIERRRQERIEDARIEYEQKLADQRIAKQRELEDLNVWYDREQADLELAQERKLQTLLDGWIEEQKITEANAAEVYGILAKYFGPGGMTDSLYKYMMDSLVANTQNAIASVIPALSGLSSLTGIVGTSSGALEIGTGTSIPELSGGNKGGRGGRGGSTSGRGRAEGGNFIATRPTTVTFGEREAELVSAFPLSRVGLNEGKTDLYGSLPGGMEGMIRVFVDLSPGLEGRIVEKSMDGVGEMIEKINAVKL